jgi:CheY-like chemotaxis protein
MTMPVVGGAEMITAISARPDLRRIPVIISSFLPEAAVRARAKATPPSWVSPTSPRRFWTTLPRYLEG